MSPDPPHRHAPPYPVPDDPRPWWHLELEREVEALKANSAATEIALLGRDVGNLRQEVKESRQEVKDLRREVKPLVDESTKRSGARGSWDWVVTRLMPVVFGLGMLVLAVLAAIIATRPGP